MCMLSPSILAADPCHLLDECKLAATCCDEIHFDVMDGHFVPNLTFGPHILKGLKKELPFRYDAHLMVTDPFQMIPFFAEAGADVLTVHVEAHEVLASLERIHELGIEAGLSLRPKTPVEELLPFLKWIDRVLIMTVEPGFGGQKLIPETLEKAVWLRKQGFTGTIQADGGINQNNAELLTQKGINDLVMGTAFFRSEDPLGLAAYVHTL